MNVMDRKREKNVRKCDALVLVALISRGELREKGLLLSLLRNDEQ